MLKDGTYAAWFKTPLGQGTGIAHIADGQLWGSDSIMSYKGSCDVDGDRFTATVSIKRHTEGHATVFGVDDLSLKIAGTCVGKVATFVGTADQAPTVLLEGMLIFSEQQPAPEANKPRSMLSPSRLPKIPNRSR